ncbi:hypothetical protein ACFV6G_26515 [Streptomyces lavendulae]|uniref:hypothetical protein n=1 Tax=Streptomyces lavendulae TaxID=1914 RepID=UPI0036987E79
MSQTSSTQQPDPFPAPQQQPAPPTPAGIAVLPLLVLLFVLVVLIIGAGLLYLTVAHPALAVPLTVAVGGVTVILTIAGVIAAFITASRR